MRTIVVFRLLPGVLKVCELEDVVTPLVRGASRVDESGRYQVVDVDEYVGVTRSEGGRSISGNEKLMTMLAHHFDTQQLPMLLSTIKYVGSRPSLKQTPGGILLGGGGLPDDFDNVVVVTLKLVRRVESPQSLSPSVQGAAAAVVSGLLPEDESSPVQVGDQPQVPGLAPIIVEAAALGTDAR